MKTERENSLNKSIRPGSQAVVIGSGIAGLTAARVLAKYFDQVTVIDRDWLPDEPAFRSGIPQAHHAHTLLPYGQKVLEQLFPGLVNWLVLNGAQTIDDDTETAYFDNGIWSKPEPRAARPTVACSRPMLEGSLYRRMAENPRVKILPGYEATGVSVDDQRRRVTGINIRQRQAPGAAPLHLPADLVVDASGRASKAPLWLASLGYTPPEEWRINAYAGYASRIYRHPAGFAHDWKKLYINPCPPDGLRGGVILPLEGNRWHVTLIGIAGDYPPTDEEGFLEFARSLPSPALYEAIRGAEPLGKITGFRKSENRVRRFDRMPRFLEGLLVLGDAVFTMNPVYGLGMTAAAVSSSVLNTTLQAQQTADVVEGLAEAFQKKLAGSIAALWQQAVRNEWRWPKTDISDNTEEIYAEAAVAA
jgi:2-polyprenyl-6-methoxyphenol hydroxylase-like FAD-dependent oxidoreductase